MKKYKKIIFSTGILAASLLSLAACSSQSTAKKDISFEIPSDVQTLDSSLLKDTNSWTVEGNVQEGLTRLDSKNNASLALAKSIKVSKDGLTYTIKLKDNLKWSNGDSLTAQDFVYAWQRAVNPATEAEQEFLLVPVKNASKINGLKNASQADLDSLGIKADSKTQLTVTLERPTAYFPLELALPIYYPLDQKVVEADGKSYGTTSDKTVYDGPYAFKSDKGWTGTNNSFSIYKNKNYWDAKDVKTSQVNIQVVSTPNTGVQLYKSGKLDIATLSTPDLVKANTKEKGYTSYETSRTDYIDYNQTGKVPALKNQDIREALNLATNRKAIVDTAYPGSKPATGFIATGFAKTAAGEDFAKYAKQGYTYDEAKAKELWEKGLKEIGQKSLDLSLEYASDSAQATAAANYLQENWEKDLPGLKITTHGVPFAQRISDSAAQNFQIIIDGLTGEYGDPSNLLPLFTTTGASNDGKFSSAEFDKAITAATTTDAQDSTKRFEDYKVAEKALYEGSYLNPIDFESNVVLVNPQLKGLAYHSSGLPYDFKNAYIK